jgi:DNA-binding transcriptional ArsR family regulator
MVWRIHFTAADLGRVRIGASSGPLTETMMALSMLRCPSRPPAPFRTWHTRVGGRLTSQLKPLAAIMPPGTRGLDLCTLAGSSPTIEQAVEAVLAIPAEHLFPEMEGLDRLVRLPAAAWDIMDAGSEARLRLATAAEAAYRGLIDPYWTQISARLRTEQLYRGEIAMNGGVERLLTTLNPTYIRWRPPVLEVLYKGDNDVYLNGRGLMLVPSLFVGAFPSLHTDLTDEHAAPALLFPVAHDLIATGRLWDPAPPGNGPLAALVGRTRAATLRCVVEECTTTELARRLGISLAAASQHATVLRGAGLITTRREGNTVRHALTATGIELLEAGRRSG